MIRIQVNLAAKVRLSMINFGEKFEESKLEPTEDNRLEREKKVDKLLGGVSRNNIHAEIESGPPVGKEVW
jgi:hypothetical protein